MKKYGARGALSDPPQLGESVVVLAADAEAAIAKVVVMAVEQILGSDEDMRAALTEAFLEGQRDMLAKCITAVDARIRPTLHPLENAGIGEALAALRALPEKP